VPALAVGMAIHNETLANRRVPQARESSIYYCATGDEMSLFEALQRNECADGYLMVKPIYRGAARGCSDFCLNSHNRARRRSHHDTPA